VFAVPGGSGLALAFSCLPTNRDLAKDEQRIYLVELGWAPRLTVFLVCLRDVSKKRRDA
jgi:hypothetical protein